jgi:uncharacterized protein YdaT
MPWSKGDYPDSMKNLPTPTRNKAVEIANALLRDGKEEEEAIPIAISRAKKWASNHSKSASEGSEGLAKIAYNWRS